jgi:hypothetical protein
MCVDDSYRALPSVDEILSRLEGLRERFPHRVIAGEIRRTLDEARGSIRSGSPAPSDIEARVLRALEDLATPSPPPRCSSR